MNTANRRRAAVLGVLALGCSLYFLLSHSVLDPRHPRHITAILAKPSEAATFSASPDLLIGSSSLNLGVFAGVLVVSLPGRADRRAGMERLRKTLDFQLTYVDAFSHDNPVVGEVMECLRSLRAAPNTTTSQFEWLVSQDEEALSVQDIVARFCGQSRDLGDALVSASNGTSLAERSLPDPLTCAVGNDIHGVPFTPLLPSHLILTDSKIACWLSHLEAIRRIANLGAVASPDDHGDFVTAALVLEDDVDMEQDIRPRLAAVWQSLPEDWDIVFLGHCWSNESYHPPLLLHDMAHHPGYPTSEFSLHPSHAPKCTHAYALSVTGARHLLFHLTNPPFAFSRALDQALAWLIESNRMSAYSIVPSIVVQRKVTTSDIDAGLEGTGSQWVERLQAGVLDHRL